MSEEIELAWSLSVSGAEEVKQKISDLHDQYNKGEIAVDKYAKGLNKAGAEYKALAGHQDLAIKQFRTMHPSLTALSHGMSGFTSVMRTGLAVSNAINLGMIAFQGNQSNMLELQSQSAAAQRDVNRALAEFGPESEQYAEALDKAAIASAKLKEGQDQMVAQMVQNSITFALAIGTMAGSVISAAPQMVKGIQGIVTALRALTAAQIIAAATNPYLLLAVGVAIAAALIILYWDDIVAALTSAWEWITATFGPAVTAIWESLSNAMLIAGTAIISVWNQHIVPALTAAWATIQSGFVGFVNGIIGIANFLVGAVAAGIEGYINGVISGINALISVYNNAARAVGAGTIDTVGKISISAPQIPMIPAAGGYNGIVSRPTLFLAGEGGQSERVFISPGGHGGGGGTTVVHNHFHYNIQGSIWSHRDLRRQLVRDNMESYRSRGIRGDD